MAEGGLFLFSAVRLVSTTQKKKIFVFTGKLLWFSRNDCRPVHLQHSFYRQFRHVKNFPFDVKLCMRISV